uniref:Angiotensin II receptor associated protein n=1 Tax=Salvator merianae TaxID=96440 RepID=A0A8D0C6B2_SALMN
MGYWSPSSYAWSNFTILALGAWAVGQRDSADAILMFLSGLLLTIVTDIVHFCLFYPDSEHQSDTTRFTIAVGIISLVLKPLSCFFAYRMYQERGGDCSLGSLNVAPDRSSYQPIDHPDPPQPYPDVANKTIPPRLY